MTSPAALSRHIKAEAAALGFPLAGILPTGPARTHDFYRAWLAQGHAGEMGYLQRHAEPKRDPRSLEPAARSLVVLGHPYPAAEPAPPAGDAVPRGRVSRYARARDYHEVLGEKLARLAASIARAAGRPVRHRVFLDTLPLMEREFAARAGLGWVGRNALLIHWRLGSWLFLGGLLLELPLAYDRPPPPRRVARAGGIPDPPGADALPETARLAAALRESCGSCRACLDACPTGAIVADRTVDSRRCISYHTIELKDPIPHEWRPAIGEWVFGCDICQEVCPWNRKAPPAAEPALEGDGEAARPSLPALLALDDAAFRARYRHTPLWRPRRRGLLRNAAIALGNRLAAGGRPPARGEALTALGALGKALADPEPLVRGAAAWGLGRAPMPEARALLQGAPTDEPHPQVREEVRRALAASGAAPR
jgi:epoxyqueuosine reductase